MPYAVRETSNSPSGNTDLRGAEQIEYIVTNVPDVAKPYDGMLAVDRTDAISAVTAERPSTLGGKAFRDYSYELDHEKLALVTAIYQNAGSGNAPPAAGDIEESMTTIGGRQKLTYAIDRIDTQAPSGLTAPAEADVGLAINVTDSGVQGVDVPIPVFNITISNWREKDSLPANFYTDIFNATAKVNADTFTNTRFGTFSAGTLLFLGASDTEDRATGIIRIDYQFEVLPNRTNVDVAGMTFAAKKGHELLWIQYADEEDPNTGIRTRKPVAGYIDQVHETVNFSTIPLLTP